MPAVGGHLRPALRGHHQTRAIRGHLCIHTDPGCPSSVRLRSPVLGTASPCCCPQACPLATHRDTQGCLASWSCTLSELALSVVGQARLETGTLCPTSGGSSQGPSGLFGPVSGRCPGAEGGASLQGGSAWGPTPGRASVQPGLSPARSHVGTAAKETRSPVASRVPCTSLLSVPTHTHDKCSPASPGECRVGWGGGGYYTHI